MPGPEAGRSRRRAGSGVRAGRVRCGGRPGRRGADQVRCVAMGGKAWSKSPVQRQSSRSPGTGRTSPDVLLERNVSRGTGPSSRLSGRQPDYRKPSLRMAPCSGGRSFLGVSDRPPSSASPSAAGASPPRPLFATEKSSRVWALADGFRRTLTNRRRRAAYQELSSRSGVRDATAWSVYGSREHRGVVAPDPQEPKSTRAVGHQAPTSRRPSEALSRHRSGSWTRSCAVHFATVPRAAPSTGRDHHALRRRFT